MKCDDQWATIRAISPESFDRIAAYEREFGKTISPSKRSVVEQADRGRLLFQRGAEGLAASSQQDVYTHPILESPGVWRLPAGAFHDTGGPI